MIVACYSMDVYCCNETKCAHKFQGVFQQQSRATVIGETAGECRKQLRKFGWKFADGDITCPVCLRAPALREGSGK